VIYTENKLRANYAKRWGGGGGGIKKCNKRGPQVEYKHLFTQEMGLRNPFKSDAK